ncbi:hypothetical protein Cgig2_031781 [Carnegiea gigantea]|uniref:AP-5 complex subunit beta-1 n=1 Tax=Carnegiea gigantea TaxID=171969 RepID=A0A9Q1GVT2_9CARY|nr:hypothetical protein Cgig2_031781 [Carnegiea gigantea]
MERPPKKNLSSQEWESLMEDFQRGSSGKREKWTSSLPPLSLLDLSLSSLLKKDFPLSLKLHLLVFLDDFADTLFISSPEDSDEVLSKLVIGVEAVIQSPVDGVSVSYALKEQMLVSVTSIFMTVTDFLRVRVRVRVSQLEALVAILLTIVNRPNHGMDRQTRAVTCECLRELEREYPCLLAEVVGHLWGLCQNERTHACQSYLLLLLEVIQHIVACKLNVNSVFSTGVPLVPFNIPQWVKIGGVDEDGDDEVYLKLHLEAELSGSNLKELKRVMAFLLEWPQVLTSCGMMEFMSVVMPLAVALELQPSLLKVQFFGLLYNYDPLLWHVVLMLYSQFPDTFGGQEGEIFRRLMLISKEGQQPLIFRLLVLHWLMGLVELVSKRDVEKRTLIAGMGSSFYPNVYDALALKSVKLDLLVLCSVLVDAAESCDGSSRVSALKYFEDGLVCVSAFKWLPPWSTETAVAFRTIHKFLIGASSHSDDVPSATKVVMASAIFHAIQASLSIRLLSHRFAKPAMEALSGNRNTVTRLRVASWNREPKLVPVVGSLIDRLLLCKMHCCLGENLLQIFDERLLPKVVMNYMLSSYFLIFDKIGKNVTVPPQRLLELLTKYAIFLVEKHGPNTGLKSWCQGTNVLAVCRTMLMHHHSSRLFMGLSRLFAFTSLYFPDVEVRDSARIYLRMLICIPGKKLRHILNLGDKVVGISPSPDTSSFFNVQSPRMSQELKKSRNISSYIHLERAIPLIVKQSWSLALPALGFDAEKYGYIEGTKDSEPQMSGKDSNFDNNIEIIPGIKRIEQPQEPLRVMDSKISEIVDILRMHFSCIPHYRHMSGLKINIPCTLRFQSEPFIRIWCSDPPGRSAEELKAVPTMYAIVLKFSSSAPYGSIPSYRIPFLHGEPFSGESLLPHGSMDIVPVGTPPILTLGSGSLVTIELEPREPVPGIVDVSIDANADNGQVIRGKLQGVAVGIEDMFLKAVRPTEIPEDELPEYYSHLFDALWEACGSSSNTGREMFSLKGGKGFAAIYGTQSVKLLEVPANFAIRVVEQYLADFVVSVIGTSLVEIVKDGGFIKEVTWIDVVSDSSDESKSITVSDGGPLCLTYFDNEDDKYRRANIGKTNMGCFLVLIFLPPRYHLLFRMEVSDVSTLVRIRTDHWPCLAYVDDLLEALFSL